MPVIEFKKIDFKKKRDRVFFKSITGSNSQLCVFRLEKGEKTNHSHPMEQMGYILLGQVELFIEEQTYTLNPGDGYHIPSGVRHGFHVKTENPVEYIEVFTPPKTENIY